MLTLNNNLGPIEDLSKINLLEKQFFAIVLNDDGGNDRGFDKDEEGRIYVSKNPYYRYSPARGKTVLVHVDEGDGIRLLSKP